MVELKDFEDDMLRMIQSVKFKQVNNPFLNKLKEDAVRIKNEPKLLIAADKTTDFLNKPTCRLINATKSEIGKISKNILDRINSTIAKKHNFNQWKNTTAVINWFKSIENKQQFSFICFDIEEFYPSSSQDLLNKALDFASNYDNITTEERNIIIHAKNSILIHKHIPWQKKGNTTFDVTLGSLRNDDADGNDDATKQ